MLYPSVVNPIYKYQAWGEMWNQTEEERKRIEQELKDAGPGDERQPLSLKKKKLEAQMLRTQKDIAALEAKLN